MRKNSKVYWVAVDRDGVDFFTEEPPTHRPYGVLLGPHKTLAAAKRDAIGYYQCDIRDARMHIAEIRAYKESKVPNEPA